MSFHITKTAALNYHRRGNNGTIRIGWFMITYDTQTIEDDSIVLLTPTTYCTTNDAGATYFNLIDKIFGADCRLAVKAPLTLSETVSTSDGKWVANKSTLFAVRKKYGITWKRVKLWDGYTFTTIPSCYDNVSIISANHCFKGTTVLAAIDNLITISVEIRGLNNELIANLRKTCS